jgi:hypothetical protein
MQLLEYIGPFGALVAAILFGAAIGLSLSHQLKLQQIARESPTNKDASLVQRITFAGLSMSLLFLGLIVSKHVSGMTYQAFVLIMGATAVVVLVLRRRGWMSK